MLFRPFPVEIFFRFFLRFFLLFVPPIPPGRIKKNQISDADRVDRLNLISDPYSTPQKTYNLKKVIFLN